MTRARILDRVSNLTAHDQQLKVGVPPELARLHAARGVDGPEQLPKRLDPPTDWHQPAHNKTETAAARLAITFVTGERVLVLTGYDADAATARAVVVRGLSTLGGTVNHLVTHPFPLRLWA